jgi:hypothetical protein
MLFGRTPGLALAVLAGVSVILWFVVSWFSLPGPRLGTATLLGLGTFLTVTLVASFGGVLGFWEPVVIALAASTEGSVVFVSRRMLKTLREFEASSDARKA